MCDWRWYGSYPGGNVAQSIVLKKEETNKTYTDGQPCQSIVLGGFGPVIEVFGGSFTLGVAVRNIAHTVKIWLEKIALGLRVCCIGCA